MTGHLAHSTLGQPLNCAACHEYAVAGQRSWTRRDFWQLAAYLTQVDRRQGDDGGLRLGARDFVPDNPPPDDDAPLFFEEADGRVVAVYPAFAGQAEDAVSGRVTSFDRRRVLAERISQSVDWQRRGFDFLAAALWGSDPANSGWLIETAAASPLSSLRSEVGLRLADRSTPLLAVAQAMALSEVFTHAGEGAETGGDEPSSGTPVLFSHRYRALPHEGEVAASLEQSARLLGGSGRRRRAGSRAGANSIRDPQGRRSRRAANRADIERGADSRGGLGDPSSGRRRAAAFDDRPHGGGAKGAASVPGGNRPASHTGRMEGSQHDPRRVQRPLGGFARYLGDAFVQPRIRPLGTRRELLTRSWSSVALMFFTACVAAAAFTLFAAAHWGSAFCGADLACLAAADRGAPPRGRAVGGAWLRSDVARDARRPARQSHPDYRVRVVVDHPLDPAWDVVRRTVADVDPSGSRFDVELLRERPAHCSLKCAAWLSAARDRRCFPHRHDRCGRATACGLADHTHRAARRPARRGGHGESLVRTARPWIGLADPHAWNAGALVVTSLAANPWAGCSAFRREEMLEAGLTARWLESAVDDGALGQAARAIGKRVAFVPELILVESGIVQPRVLPQLSLADPRLVAAVRSVVRLHGGTRRGEYGGGGRHGWNAAGRGVARRGSGGGRAHRRRAGLFGSVVGGLPRGPRRSPPRDAGRPRHWATLEYGALPALVRSVSGGNGRARLGGGPGGNRARVRWRAIDYRIENRAVERLNDGPFPHPSDAAENRRSI